MNKFRLVSKFKPTGDQPQAIKELAGGLRSGLKDQVLLGVTGSGKTFTMANVVEKIQKPTLVISHNKTLAAQLAAEFSEFFPDNAVHYFVSYYDYYLPESYTPQTDTYIEKETSINEEIDRLRHAATQALLSRPDVLIVASVSCIYGLGSPQEYEDISLRLEIGSHKLSRKEILKKLVEMRYERNDVDFHRGTFRVRDNALDVFPSFALDEMYRITFRDDAVSQLEILNPLSLKPQPTNHPVASADRQINQLTIFPATHYVAPMANLDNILKQIEQAMEREVDKFKQQEKLVEAQRLQQRVMHDLEMIRVTGYCNGIENYSRYFDGRETGVPPYVLLDYFANDWLMFIDESHMTIPQIRGMYAGDRSRKQILINYGFRLSAAFDNRPLKFEEFEQKRPQTIYVSATPGPYELEKLVSNNKQRTSRNKKLSAVGVARRKSSVGLAEQLIRPTGLLDPAIEIRPTKHQIDSLVAEIQKTVVKKQRVLVTTMTKRMSEDLADYLQESGIKAYYLHSEINTLERLEILRDLRSGVYDVVVGINLLREGLDLPEVSLAVILDADKEGFLRSDTALIQTMGRAARHKDGRVIMYADKTTSSMRRAIGEVTRRRQIQIVYNKKHGLTPKSIKKAVKPGILGLVRQESQELLGELPKKIDKLPAEELKSVISDFSDQMDLAAQNLEFETAARLRDQIKVLEEQLQEVQIKKAAKRGDQFAALRSLK